MTNPNNAIGTNGAYGGRTSVNAFNDVLSAFATVDHQDGIVSGWVAEVNDIYNLSIGGSDRVRDVAIAKDPNGNLTTINNISGSPILLNMPNPPVTGSRYDMVVAYVVNPPQGTDKVVDNPEACGLIVVDGGEGGMNASGADEQIRQAITQDGAAGTTAYYVVLCEVFRQAGELGINTGYITPGRDVNMGNKFPLQPYNVDWPSFGSKYAQNLQPTGTVKNNVYVSAASLSLTERGTYIVMATSRAEFFGGDNQNFYMRIFDKTQDQAISPVSGFYGGKQGGVLGQFTISALGQVVVGDYGATIESQVTATGSSGGFANNSSIAAIRIG